MWTELSQVFHAFNFFFGTLTGEFFKQAAEAVLLAFVSYMILSEYLRSRERKVKFLLAGFIGLTFQRLLMTASLGLVVFGTVTAHTLDAQIPVIANALELFSLSLIGIGFFTTRMSLPRTNQAKRWLWGIGLLLVL